MACFRGYSHASSYRLRAVYICTPSGIPRPHMPTSHTVWRTERIKSALYNPYGEGHVSTRPCGHASSLRSYRAGPSTANCYDPDTYAHVWYDTWATNCCKVTKISKSKYYSVQRTPTLRVRPQGIKTFVALLYVLYAHTVYYAYRAIDLFDVTFLLYCENWVRVMVGVEI